MIAYELLGERSSYELLILSKSFEFWSQNYVKIILFFWFKISATIDFIIYLQFSGRVRLANQLYSNEVMKFESTDYFIQLCYSHLVVGENQVIQLKPDPRTMTYSRQEDGSGTFHVDIYPTFFIIMVNSTFIRSTSCIFTS